jgi:hypothetical protein
LKVGRKMVAKTKEQEIFVVYVHWEKITLINAL